MTYDPATEIIVRERIEDKLRYAEQARLAQGIRNSTGPAGWLSDGRAAFVDLRARFFSIIIQQVVCRMNPSALGC